MCCKKDKIIDEAEAVGETYVICMCGAEYYFDENKRKWRKIKSGAEGYQGA
jgi:hypothetical protein